MPGPTTEALNDDLRDIRADMATMRADVHAIALAVARLVGVRTTGATAADDAHPLMDSVTASELQDEDERGQARPGPFRSSDSPQTDAVSVPARPGRAIERDEQETRFDAEIAERHYQALGRWKGPLAAASVQDAARNFWRSAGSEGANWLAHRLRSETLVEPLHAAASTLTEMGAGAILPVLEELACSPEPDQALALLKALGWMAADHRELRQPPDPTVRIVARYLQSRDADTREAAAEALRIVAPEHSVAWLEARLDVERNEDVIATIRDMLTQARRSGV